MGRRQWEQTVAAIPREIMTFAGQDKPEVVAPGGTEVVTFYSAPGTVSRLINLALTLNRIPSSTGTHAIEIKQPTATLIRGASNGADDIIWRYSGWDKATSEKKPATEDAQLLAIKGVLFDAVNPITFTYTNNTDKATSLLRSYRLTMIQSDAAR